MWKGCMTTRSEFQLGLYYFCHAQILADLSTWPTERDRLEPSTPCANVLTCSTQGSPVHRVQMHGASNRDTHFVLAAQQLISLSDNNNNIRGAHWADHQWNADWADNPSRLRTFIPNTGTHPLGLTLPRTAWVRFNHFCTGVGCFLSCLDRWGTVSSAACECGAKEQTADHVVLQCPIHRPPHGLHGLTVLDDETIKWLLNTRPEIYAKSQVLTIWTKPPLHPDLRFRD